MAEIKWLNYIFSFCDILKIRCRTITRGVFTATQTPTKNPNNNRRYSVKTWTLKKVKRVGHLPITSSLACRIGSASTADAAIFSATIPSGYSVCKNMLKWISFLCIHIYVIRIVHMQLYILMQWLKWAQTGWLNSPQLPKFSRIIIVTFISFRNHKPLPMTSTGRKNTTFPITPFFQF